jgi:beta-glucanase (GH16 family)
VDNDTTRNNWLEPKQPHRGRPSASGEMHETQPHSRPRFRSGEQLQPRLPLTQPLLQQSEDDLVALPPWPDQLSLDDESELSDHLDDDDVGDPAPASSHFSSDYWQQKLNRQIHYWFLGAGVVLSVLTTVIIVFNATAGSKGAIRPGTQTQSTALAAGTIKTVTASPSPSATSVLPTATSTIPQQIGPFTLAFDDEFNGSSINQNDWSLYSGQPGGNNATQWVPSLCREQNGSLILPIEAQPANGRPLSACGLSGEPASTQTYGKYVYRARLDPGYHWYGMFLLWPNSGNWPDAGEIDFCEFADADVTRTTCSMFVHWGVNGTDQFVEGDAPGDFTQWHVFTLTWLPGSITYQIDGQTVFAVTQHVPSAPFWPAFQVMGDDSARQFGSLYIDYIRIYKYTGS